MSHAVPPAVNGGYTGRFAPSPTGPLHEGSLVAALASWLDARAHQGRWLVRLEDTDTPRCQAGAGELILQQLAACGLLPDGPVVWQSARGELYQAALERLVADGAAYPCGCSRKDIADAWLARGLPPRRHAGLVYPGTCRHGLQGRAPRAWRLRSDGPDGGDLWMDWLDRRLGPQRQNLTREVGDFVLKRADGLWAYQLAVVVDDAAQGVTHVVRGEDLADNTPRQIHLQGRLGLPTPHYLHTPLVLAADGQKLSKQTGAAALALEDPLRALSGAARRLGLTLPPAGARLGDWLAAAVGAWQAHAAGAMA